MPFFQHRIHFGESGRGVGAAAAVWVVVEGVAFLVNAGVVANRLAVGGEPVAA